MTDFGLMESFSLLDEPFELVKWVLLSGPIADRPQPYASVEELLRAFIDRHTRYTVTRFDFDENDDYVITISGIEGFDFRLPTWLQNLGNGEMAIFAFRFLASKTPLPSYYNEPIEPAKFVVEVLAQWQKVMRWE